MKIGKFLTVCIAFLVSTIVFCGGCAFAEEGEGAFRDMFRQGSEHLGHVGMDVGGNQIIHMQSKAGCCKDSFSSSFSSKFWGYITQGDTKATKTRIREAEDIYSNKKPKYSFLCYKSYPKKFRCDGLVEHCFEKAGGNIVLDWGFFSLSPLKQWQSSRIQMKQVTSRGSVRKYLVIKGDPQMVEEYIDSL